MAEFTVGTATTATPKPGTTTLPSPYHMTFRVMKDGAEMRRFTFIINPQSYVFGGVTNNTAVQTLDGGFTNIFGRGLATLQIQGTTASQSHLTYQHTYMSGLQALQYLYDYIFAEFTDNQFQDPAHTYELRFYNWTLNHYFSVIFPTQGFQLQADITHPIWWYYTMNFVVIDILPAPTNFKQSPLGSAALENLPTNVAVTTQIVDPLLRAFSTEATGTALTYSNNLVIAKAQLLGLIGQGSTAGLSVQDQQTLAAYPVPYDPTSVLNTANYPSYQQYTGIPAQTTNDSSTVVGLLRTTVDPVVGALGQATQPVVSIPYTQIETGIQQWRQLRTTIYNQYSAAPPTQLLGLMGRVITGLSGLAALQGVYTPSATGLVLPL